MRSTFLAVPFALALAAPAFAQTSPAPDAMGSTAPMTGGASSSQVQVQLRAQNNSGVTGTATLSNVKGGVQVVISTMGQPADAEPAHIHTGTCAKLDPAPKYALKSVTKGVDGGGQPVGTSTTVVKGVTLAELTSSPYAINLHKSANDLKDYVACGDLNGANPTGTSQ